MTPETRKAIEQYIEKYIEGGPAYGQQARWLRECLDEIKRLRKLVVHMWVHDGYPKNGYNKMASEQKILYEAIIKERGDE